MSIEVSEQDERPISVPVGQCLDEALLSWPDSPGLAVAALRSWLPATKSTSTSAPPPVRAGVSCLCKLMSNNDDTPNAGSSRGLTGWTKELHHAGLAAALSEVCARWPLDGELLESSLDALCSLAHDVVANEVMAAHAAAHAQHNGAHNVLALALERADSDDIEAELKLKILESAFSLVGQMTLSEDGLGGTALLALCRVAEALEKALNAAGAAAASAATEDDQLKCEEMVKRCGCAIYNLGMTGKSDDAQHARLLAEAGLVEAAVGACKAMPSSGVFQRYGLGSIAAIIEFHKPSRETAVRCGLKKIAEGAMKKKFKKDGKHAKNFASECLRLIKEEVADLRKQQQEEEEIQSLPTSSSSSTTSSSSSSSRNSVPRMNTRSATIQKISTPLEATDTPVKEKGRGARKNCTPVEVASPPSATSLRKADKRAAAKDQPKALSFASGAHEAQAEPSASAASTKGPGKRPLSSSSFSSSSLSLSSSSLSSRAHSEVCPSATSYFDSRRNNGRPAMAPTKRPHAHVSQRMGDAKLRKLGLSGDEVRSGKSTIVRRAQHEEDNEAAAAAAEEDNASDEDESELSGDPIPKELAQKQRGRVAPPALVCPAGDEKLVPAPLDPEHRAATKALFERHRQRFSTWQSLLLQGGFNVLLYGFGSKHALLSEFRERNLRNTIVVEAKGWQASTSAETVRDASLPSLRRSN
jgi:hypothetical protein